MPLGPPKGQGPARRLGAALVGSGLVAAALVAPTAVVGVPSAVAQAGGPCVSTLYGTTNEVTTCTYTYTGAEQQFTVPPDVANGLLKVDAIGAAGRGGSYGTWQTGFPSDFNCESNTQFGGPTWHLSAPPGAGGGGSEVSGYIPVSAGEKLYVEVGGMAQDFGTVDTGPDDSPYGPQDVGGWNGGGTGGLPSPSDDASDCGGVGGGGGGASDVQTCSVTWTSSSIFNPYQRLAASPCSAAYGTATDPRLIVAAGGGGGGGAGGSNVSNGFNGGGAGQSGTGDGTTFVQGGGAGANGPGAGGTGGTSSVIVAVGGGGGGGGGWYGGSGGSGGSFGGGAGGGGGSDLVPPSGTDFGPTAKPAQVVIVYDQLLNTSTTSLSASSSSPVVGQPVTYSAVVSSSGQPAPTGTVTFTDGTATVCSAVPLSMGVIPVPFGTPIVFYAATCSQTYHGTGPQTVTAAYSGDTSTSGSQGSVAVAVQKAATTTAVTASANPSPQGQAVTFTATVTAQAPGAGTPTGTVAFVANGSYIGPGTLGNNGQATLTTSKLAAGSEPVTAQYEGDGNYLSSPMSAPLTENVEPSN